MKKTENPAVVSLERCRGYGDADLREALRRSFEPFGGIEKYISTGERVLLKPNMLSAKAPERAITTHPEVIRVMAEMIRDLGAEPFIGDSPGGVLRGVKRVWENTGIQDMAARNDIELVSFEGSGSEEIDAGGYRFYVARPVLEADRVINLAKLKTHTLTLLTAAVKNMFGVVPGFRKSVQHKMFPKPGEFAEMLVELYRIVKPDFSIVDAVLAMEGNGPSSGEPVELGLIMAGEDAVAVDAVAADIIGYRSGLVDSTRIAGERGVGVSDLGKISREGTAARFRAEAFELTSNTGIRMIPDFLVRLVKPLVWIRPEIDPGRCTGCRLCEKSCPVEAISFDGKVCRIDSAKCVNCMCCHELCPENAVEVRMSRLARMIS
jgi:uncharacterized protein (DUF362 family)/NAD-dependent dihydropyrimidine dehydrogenase PreA subunit